MELPREPIRFRPVYKDYLWGGNQIAVHFGRDDLPPPPVAESWEVSAHPDGMSVVAEGPLRGQTLAALVERFGAELLGRDFDRFPLLLKILDASHTLSVQVHPNEEAARRDGGEPKTEMWMVLSAEPDAAVYCGLRPGVDEAALRAGIERGAVEELLQRIPVRAGDAVFVPAGTVHAIGAGCLLMEVQQSSNTTYRLHDWGRGRELHLERGLRAVCWDCAPDKVAARDGVDCEFFRTDWLRCAAPRELPVVDDGFQILFPVRGVVSIGGVERAPGETVLVPAGVAAGLDPRGDQAELVRVLV